MINLDIIEKEILDLEKKDTSYATIERLSWLYTVRDHINPVQDVKMTGNLIGDEFAEICSNIPIQNLMPILSEHMQSIQLLYPREYEILVNKIKALK